MLENAFAGFWTRAERRAIVEEMASKKRTSDARGEYLALRLTKDERKELTRVAKRFPAMVESAVARIALLEGLKVLEAQGIKLPPT
jgi:hypothetical protein